MVKSVAMIPARLGSQRLKKKNLELFGNVPLIEHAVQRCVAAGAFDSIYINSESLIFKEFAERNNICFHHRPEHLGNNIATSEDFVEEFFANVDCDFLYQIHSITPLLSAKDIRNFVTFCEENPKFDTVFSCIEDQIEVSYQGTPVNFTTTKKTNSQELLPTQRITWSATKWTRDTFLGAKKDGKIGTYSGEVGYFAVGHFTGLAIKTLEDLNIANALRGLA